MSRNEYGYAFFIQGPEMEKFLDSSKLKVEEINRKKLSVVGLRRQVRSRRIF